MYRREFSIKPFFHLRKAAKLAIQKSVIKSKVPQFLHLLIYSECGKSQLTVIHMKNNTIINQ